MWAWNGLVMGALCASIFGLVSALFDLSVGEGWVRLDSSTSGQGRVPMSHLRVVGGFYFHRLKLAHLLMMVASLAVAAALTQKRFLARLLWFIVALFLSIALMLTYARAGSLALGLGVGVMLLSLAYGATAAEGFLLRRCTPAGMAGPLCVAVMICVAWFKMPSVAARLKSSHSSEARAVRAIIWSQAVHIIHLHPFGVGLGRYPEVVATVFAEREPLSPSPRTYPHSMPLAMWAEGGPVALMAFLVGYGCLLRQAAVSVWDRASMASVQAGLATLGVLTALGFVGLSHDVFFHQVVAMVAYATLGLLGARCQMR